MMGERGGGGTHSLTGHGQWPLEGSGKTQTAIRWMSNGELTNPQLNMLDILCLFFRNIFSRQMCTCCIKVQACQGRVEQEEQRSDKFLSGRSDDCDQSGPGVISGRSQCPAATNCQTTRASGLTLADDATDHGVDGGRPSLVTLMTPGLHSCSQSQVLICRTQPQSQPAPRAQNANVRCTGTICLP